MYISDNIDMDELISIIKEPHSTQETIEIINKLIEFDDNDSIDDYWTHSTENDTIVASAILQQYDINDIISNFKDSNIILNCFFEYLKTHDDAAKNIYQLEDILDLLVDEGYIVKTGLCSIEDYDYVYGDTSSIKRFSEIDGCDFVWLVQECSINSDYKDVILELIKDYLDLDDNLKYSEAYEIYTNDPYGFIEQNYFSGFNGAKEEDVLSILFENFNELKEDYIDYFGNIMPITKDTTLDEFKHMCYEANYSEFRDAYYELIHVSDFLHNTGVYDNYFG